MLEGLLTFPLITYTKIPYEVLVMRNVDTLLLSTSVDPNLWTLVSF